jgi:menaquinone-dependent protoporphyrinogen IX oxidase
MKGVIIYKGKYGATKQYAEWLSTELKLPVIPADNINGKSLKGYDFFVLGSSVYIGKLQLKKWLKKNLPFLSGKKIFLFQVAGTDPGEIKKRQLYNDTGIPKELAGNCDAYFLPGRLKIKSLSWLDRLLLRIGARLAKNADEKTIMLTNYDEVKKEELSCMVDSLQSFLMPISQHTAKYSD